MDEAAPTGQESPGIGEAITKVEEKIATQEQTCNAVTEEISAASKQCGARAEELESMRLWEQVVINVEALGNSRNQKTVKRAGTNCSFERGIQYSLEHGRKQMSHRAYLVLRT
eukprot:2370327-Amphidinium_carterae.1